MKDRLLLWALAGFLVALCWVLLSSVIPISSHPLLWKLAQVTCPIAFFARFAIKWYWAVLSNGPIYLLLGMIIEGLLRLGHLRSASA